MDWLINWVENSKGIWFYLLVFISSLAENLFTPLPGDSVTVFGAYLAGRSQANLYGVYLSSVLGGGIGFVGLYFIGGALYGRGVRRNRLFGFNINAVEKVSAKFRRWGYLVILFNRFFWGIRFAVAIFAGIARLPLGKTLFFAFIGIGIWNAILVYLGGQLGENWRSAKPILGHFSLLFWAIAIILVIIVLGWKLIGRNRGAVRK